MILLFTKNLMNGSYSDSPYGTEVVAHQGPVGRFKAADNKAVCYRLSASGGGTARESTTRCLFLRQRRSPYPISRPFHTSATGLELRQLRGVHTQGGGGESAQNFGHAPLSSVNLESSIIDFTGNRHGKKAVV